ncbi:hypothetical protein DS745_07490 [Anaerobacillus alkaliphilus]|uniref:Uncharacterized protein n=1 Tax=Anaerobacillus alkaliphilus TaxID=1548597 RepID=A0A4Q0VUX7_9BACI|nr:hypothetical protein [Anaerobacillus alkaliphilus]RXJ02224.1 hypothetical protein DS745_07490 [Anaerobacillus alkaliphilus]
MDTEYLDQATVEVDQTSELIKSVNHTGVTLEDINRDPSYFDVHYGKLEQLRVEGNIKEIMTHNDPLSQVNRIIFQELKFFSYSLTTVELSNLHNDNQSENSSQDSGIHRVEPHFVEGYTKANGTEVQGYWRDGDGDTSVNRTAEEGGGYNRSNPDGNPDNNLR